MVDEPANDYRVGERDDNFENARAMISCRRHRISVAQTIVAYRNPVDFRDQEGRLVNVEAVILLIHVYDRPLFRVAKFDSLIRACLIHGAVIDQEYLAVWGPRISQPSTSRDRRRANVVNPSRPIMR